MHAVCHLPGSAAGENDEHADVLGWCGYTRSAVLGPVGCITKFSETTLEMASGSEVNIQFTGNGSGGHSCSQHANCILPQNLTAEALCYAIKVHILEWPFMVTSARHACGLGVKTKVLRLYFFSVYIHLNNYYYDCDQIYKP